MKRSRRVALISMGAATLSLAACEEEKTATHIYELAEQCIQGGFFSTEQCEADFKVAREQHAEVAPKYLSKADCEADFGNGQCETSPYETSSGGSVFMPLLAGYLMGSMLSGGGRTAATQPLYRSGDDRSGFRTGQNVRVGDKVGLNQSPRSAVSSVQPNMRPVPRGGFGSRARAFGSVGS
ncbi:MAG: DUF1190 domain-containing protein [Minwuia sp.]|uniref:DUF1190 domain-containing protein n=1 Tax=Minwuia sp. TaxID=2493630 RepID=UPI003A89A3EF